MKQRLSILIIAIFCHLALMAQAGLDVAGETDGSDAANQPAFVPMVKVGKALYKGDSIQYVELNPLAIYPQLVFKDEKQEVITRKEVTSAIVLNEETFESLKNQKQGVTAMIYPIRILIQPRYLYVLADEDAYTGHLLID